jgi:hypothetical protein
VGGVEPLEMVRVGDGLDDEVLLDEDEEEE